MKCLQLYWIRGLFFILVVVMSSCTKLDEIDYPFQNKQIDIPTGLGRASANAFVVNGYGYMLCGRNATVTGYLKDVWRFDTTSLSWTRMNDFPGTARVKGVATVVGNKAYFGLGFNMEVAGNVTPGSYFKDFYEYTPATDTWKRLADFPTVKGVTAAFAYSVGTNVFVATGSDDIWTSDTCWRYNTELNEWSKVPKFPYAASNIVCVQAKGRTFAGAGFSYNITSWYELDTSTYKWNERPSMPDKGRLSAVGFTDGDYVYVGAGRHWGDDGTARGVLSSLLAYNLNSNQWNMAGDLPGSGREGAIAFSIGNKIFYGFGEDNDSVLGDFWQLSLHSTLK